MHGENVERPIGVQGAVAVVAGWTAGDGCSSTVAALGKRSSPARDRSCLHGTWVNAFFGITDGPVTTFHVATVPLGKDGSFSVLLPEFCN